MKVLSVQQTIYIKWVQIQGKMIWNQAGKDGHSGEEAPAKVELQHQREVG
jgi:hypothetical protein